MSSPQSLSDRVAKLRQRHNTNRSGSIPSAEPNPGDWGPGRLAFPASCTQSRLWFLQQLETDLAAYHLPVLWQLRGKLNLNALRLALADLIERHGSLRTSFCLQDSEVLQIIHPPAPLPLDEEVTGGRNVDAVVEQWLEQERTTPFDLASGCLIRARLLAVDHQHHLLLLNHHPIACDGWSRSVLVRDLTELYNARLTGQASTLVPLQVQYHDYAVWQRQRLSGDRLQTLKDYWIPQLTGLPALDLPSDHPRPSTQSHQGGSVCFQITAELLAPFEQLCRSEGATLQIGLLALLALLLHLYSRQDDFAIGISISGRNHPDLEPLIGSFINTLPIRTRLAPQQSFRQLLGQVKASSFAAYDHQEIPFEQIVEALNLPRDTSRNPLAQVMLQFIELPEGAPNKLDGLQVDEQTVEDYASRFDLDFCLRRASSGIEGAIIYATEIFSADRIERLSSHFLTLCRSALAAPDASVASLCLLPDGERLQIESWQHGPIAAVPDTCVHQLFEQQAERTPGTLALAFDNQQFSYFELNESANRLAHHLIDLGVGPEVIVAVCLERSPASVVSLLAVLKAGGTYLPLEPHWPPERLKEIILDSATSIILVDSEATASAFRETIQSILLPLLDLSKSPSANPAPVRCAPAQLAYILYTSGSTGKPKGTRVEHKTLNNLLYWSKNEERLSKPAKTLQYAANVFDVSLQEIFAALTTGGSLWLISDRARRDFRKLYSLLIDAQIERIFMPYVALEQLSIYATTQTSRYMLNLRDIVSAGEALILTEPIRKLLTSMPDCRLHNHYGPTESHVVTACCADDMLGADNDEVSIGRPISNSIIYILDSLGCPCPIGIPGEIHIGGAGLARDYLNNPELTAEKFIPDPFSPGPAARLYRSGDLASWNADGTLAFHGRIDQQIKLRGFRIEPGEIEAALLAHPGVAQAAVELRKDDPANPRLIAYWVPLEAIRSKPDFVAAGANAGGPGTAQLRAFLADRLPDYMVPAGFVELEALPLTANGKLDRQALPAASFSGDEQQRVAPSTDLERQLHGIWAEVLGHSEFGTSDNFFSIGGHSLAAARLVSRIEENLGQRLPLASLFQSPTLAALASRLTDGVDLDHRSFRSLVMVQGQGESSPLFVIHGGGGDVFIHVHLARCLAPRRPVYGLQAVGIDGSEARHRTVEEMASHYASEILRLRPQGPLHLLGYSGGGWYAWAVAAEILRRGGCLGLIGLVDTQGTADLHRRLRLEQLLLNGAQQLLRQLSHWRNTSSLPQWNSLRHKLEAFRFHSWTLLRTPGGMAPQALDPDATPRPTQPLRGDYFLQIHTYYRPPRLPVRADIFSTPSAENKQRKLWNFYATGKAYLHPALLDHNDYYNADFMPVFAERLDALINDIEAQEPQCQPRVERLLGH